MKVLILAAGIGKRLKSKKPKILLKIGKKTLLERHYENITNANINKIGLVVGYKSKEIEDAVKKIDIDNKITIFQNPSFTKGSVLSITAASKFFESEEELILMDGDVLYDKRILQKLINSNIKNCFLLDRDFDDGDEPVKISIKKNQICDFGKKIKKLNDFYGESVGFFKFTFEISKKFLFKAEHIANLNINEPYEEAIRFLLYENDLKKFGYEDISAFSWIEIDFPEDLNKAKLKILPNINE